MESAEDRRDSAAHRYIREALIHWPAVVGATLIIWMAVLTFYVVVGKPLGDVPVIGGDTNIVPTTGEQGYPVYEFCKNEVGAVLTVTKNKYVSPDTAPLRAEYTLDRVFNSVHESISVKVPLDENEQPVGVHYDSDNNQSDAFVSKDAMKCIEEKAK